MPIQNKKKTSFLNAYGVMLFILAAILITTVYQLWNSIEEPSEDYHDYSPKDWSRKLIEVKKEPLKAIKMAHLGSSTTSPEKEKAAQQVIYNEMLSRIETRLGITMAVPPASVEQSTEKDLDQLYGDPGQVPRSVYRTACLRIFNSRGDFEQFYSGNHQKVKEVVYEVMRDFYDQGLPPAGSSISDFELYLKKHPKPSKTLTLSTAQRTPTQAQ